MSLTIVKCFFLQKICYDILLNVVISSSVAIVSITLPLVSSTINRIKKVPAMQLTANRRKHPCKLIVSIRCGNSLSAKNNPKCNRIVEIDNPAGRI